MTHRGYCQHGCFAEQFVEIELGEQASSRSVWLIAQRRPQGFLAFALVVPPSPNPDEPEDRNRHRDSNDPARKVPIQFP